LFLTLGLPPVLHDVKNFADLPQRIPVLVAKIKRLPMADKIGVDSLAERSENMISSTAQYLLASAPLWLGKVFDMVAALILCIYFMLEGEFAYYYFLSFFHPKSRERLARTLVAAEVRMSKWLLGQGSLMLILGVTSTIVFSLLHVRYAILLGAADGAVQYHPGGRRGDYHPAGGGGGGD
jgi:predicted PurR-regulated permease PerM